MPQEKKTKIREIEQEIGRGKKPIGEFGFGQLIAFFSRSDLFHIVRQISGTEVLDAKRLYEINEPRIDQTHYDEEAIGAEADEIRRYTTEVLLKFKLIEKDPDEPIEIRRERARRVYDLQALQRRTEKLRRMVEKIRRRLAGQAYVDQNYEIIPDDWGSKYYHVEVEAEIVAVYLEEDESLTALVRANWLATHVEVMEESYEKLVKQVCEITERIEPNAKENLNVLIYDDWSIIAREPSWEHWTNE